jgi:WbqC-like protein family
MKAAIMQPYFLPYIGYWQLINSVDHFIVYDNIQYTKRGWINRNRFLQNGKPHVFTVPLENDSDYLDVGERSISAAFNRRKLINQLDGAYARATNSKKVLPILRDVISYDDSNLFGYILNSIKEICKYLEIDTKVVISSEVEIDHSLRGEDRVLAICRAEQATVYVNTAGGTELYNRERFRTEGIDLRFIKSKDIEYRQFDNEFVPWLSILDVMMFNDKAKIKQYLEEYALS